MTRLEKVSPRRKGASHSAPRLSWTAGTPVAILLLVRDELVLSWTALSRVTPPSGRKPGSGSPKIIHSMPWLRGVPPTRESSIELVLGGFNAGTNGLAMKFG